jgi:hypothetical protein
LKIAPPVQLERMNGQEVFDCLLDSNLSERTKRELVEWLWAHSMLSDDQYALAVSRIEHLEKQSQNGRFRRREMQKLRLGKDRSSGDTCLLGMFVEMAERETAIISLRADV